MIDQHAKNGQTPARCGMRLREAARLLGIDASTLRRDIRAGCPVVELGSVGRSKGTRVDLDQVRRWRATKHGEVLPTLEAALLDVFRDAIHEKLKIQPGQLAYLLIRIYEKVYEDVTHLPLVELPEEMRRLCTICLDFLEHGHREQED